MSKYDYIDNYASAKNLEKRNNLHLSLPLDTPYVIGVYMGDFCNFSCVYCAQSLPNEHEERKHLIRKYFSYEDFTKVIDQLLCFPKKIKTLVLTSVGEPTLNRYLPEMIEYAYKKDIAECIQLVTNGSLLTRDLSKKIIDAGLSKIVVSIQGVTEEKYKRVCNYNINMKKFIENLTFLYTYSRNAGGGGCKIHIKTVDVALDKGEEDVFINMFKNICDTIHIDNVFPGFLGVDYEGMVSGLKKCEDTVSEKLECCPTPFYMLYVLPNGNVVPCCIAHQPIIYGNFHKRKITEIWNSKIRNNFLKLHLCHNRGMHPVCKVCEVPDHSVSQEDILDDHTEELLKKFSFVEK